MKRVLSLILVLGLASTANAVPIPYIYINGSSAGPEYDVVMGNTISIEIYRLDDDETYDCLSFEDNSLYTLANPTVTTNAGEYGSYYGPFTYPTYYPGVVLYQVSRAGSGISPGTMFLVDFTAGSTTGTVDVNVYDENFTLWDSVTINIVPEPMTITLLALGGLAVLRKRK